MGDCNRTALAVKIGTDIDEESWTGARISRVFYRHAVDWT